MEKVDFRHSIGTKFIFGIAAVIAGMLLVILLIVQQVTSKMMTEQAKEALIYMSHSYCSDLDGDMMKAVSVISTMKDNSQIHEFMENFSGNDTYEKMPSYPQIANILENAMISDVFEGAYIAIDKPNKLIDGKGFQQPADYQLSARPWYQSTMRDRKIHYSEPYTDVVSGNTIISLSSGVYDKNDVFQGAVLIDISINSILEIINEKKLYDTGYAILVSTEGTIVCSPHQDDINSGNLNNMLRESSQDALYILNTGEGIVKTKLDGSSKYFSYHPIGNSNLILCLIVPEKEVYSKIYSLMQIIAIAGIIALIISIVLVRLLTNGLCVSIKYYSELFGSIANGDISCEVEERFLAKNDEIGVLGRSAHNMIIMLNNVISSIMETSREVNQSSDSVMNNAKGLESGISTQIQISEFLTDVSSKLSDNTNENTKNAQLSCTLAEKAKASAIAGNKHMEEMLSSMSEISQASNDIAKIIKVIDDIAFQTNILALNAAVEAARAGSHGKGFAVVAEEVRNLASKSSQAANETSAIISMSNDKTKKGTAIANNTADALAGIAKDIEQTLKIAANIAHDSLEQSKLITDMSRSISEIGSVVKATEASSAESATTSRNLSEQVAILESQISKFNLLRSMSSDGPGMFNGVKLIES